MTYCVGIKVKDGLVFCSDSRTNSGIDQANISRKVFTFERVGQCRYYLLVAGNLATTQAVVNQIHKDIDTNAEANLLSMASVQDAADYIGQLNLQQQSKTGGGAVFQATFILGGQIQSHQQELAMIYSEGNYITATELMPFLQIGESKYGKPILDRIIKPDTDLQTCALCALVSMDSTIKSNLSVGPPIDIEIYYANSLHAGESYHLEEDNPFLRKINATWNQKMIESFLQLPKLSASNVIEQNSF